MKKDNRHRKEPHGRAQDTEPPARGVVSPLLKRLMDKLAGQRADRERTGGASPPLPQAGGRSGSGSDSLAPFLEESRNSRPGPLE